MSAMRARVVVGAISLVAVIVPTAAFARGGVGGGRRVPPPVVPPVVAPPVVVPPAPVDVPPAPVVVPPAPVDVPPAPVDVPPAPVDLPPPAPVDVPPTPVVVPPAPVDVPPAPVAPTTCALVKAFQPSGGFRPSSNNSVGAIWTSFKVSNCGTAAATYHMSLIETVDGRPDLHFSWSPVVTLDPRKDYSAGNIDNDLTPLDTLYHVRLEVRDDDGVLLQFEEADVMAGETKSLVP